jgi:hypothetical protein
VPQAAAFQVNTYPSAPRSTLGPLDGNGPITALGDGLLVLRFLFGFTGAPLVSGAIDAIACSTRCNAPSSEACLQTLI